MIGIGPIEMIIIICILGFFIFIAIIILAAFLMRSRLTGIGTIAPGENSLKRVEAAGGDLAGEYPAPQVSGLRGQPVSPTPPADGQVLVWNQATGQWEPRHLPETDSPSN